VGHAVLLGDSIFDNASYVPGGPPVIRQLQKRLPAGWDATLLAVDGSITADVARQLRGLPAGATHLVVSSGGNDALEQSGILLGPAGSTAEALDRMAAIAAEFRAIYRQMLIGVVRTGLPTIVCTVYDSIPGLEPAALAGLTVFNDAILREAFTAQVPVIDLRILCTEAADYSSVSPIEPSVAGGYKIAAVIAEALTGHDFSRPRSVIYP
jgi:hypothetical protein